MDQKTIIGLEVSLSIPPNGCPNACWHCPQATLVSHYPKDAPREFTLANLQRCLETVPTTRHLAWTGFSEPFLCRDAVPIMLWAHQRGHTAMISTTLRGITHEGIDAIAGLPWKCTVIHVPDAEGWMKIPVTDEYVSLFEHAVRAWKHHADFVFGNYATPHPKLLPIMEASGVPIPRFGLHDRCGTVEGLPHHRHMGRIPLCYKMFCGNLLPNGDVCLCCDDYGLQHVWGNLNTENYADIYRGKKFKAFLEQLKDPESTVLCRTCMDGYKQGFDPEHPPYLE